MALAPTQIAPTGDAPATDMTPGQQSLTKQVQFDPKAPVGSSRNPRFERPDTTPVDRAGIAPTDVTIDLAGKPRVGPYESGDLTDDFTKRVESQQAAQEEEDWKEIEREAAAEAEAKDPNAPMGAKEYFAPVGAVMGDAARTMAEAAPAVVVGIKSGINELSNLIEEIGDNTPGPYVKWEGFDGDSKTKPSIKFGIGKVSEVEGENQTRTIPQPFDADKLKQAADKIDSVGGNFIKSASQFATGWAVGGKTLKGIKTVGGAGGFVKALAQGAIADFSAFDAQEGNLSKMLNDMAPEFRNPVTDFLANDEETPELLGRAKNALEGAGLGAALDLTINGLRAMKALRKAKAEVSTEARAQGYKIDPTAGPEIAEKTSAKLERDVAAALKPAPKPKKPEGAKKLDAAGKALKGVDAKELAEDLIGTGQRSPTVKGEVPRRRFEREFAEYDKPPEPAEGMTRLWRGNRPGEIGQNPVFTNDPVGIALPFREAYKGELSFVDVPTARLKEFESTGAVAPGAEFKLPEDLAAQAKMVPFGPSQPANVFDLPMHRMNTPEDVQKVILKMAERNAVDIDGARRGVQTWADTAEKSRALDAIELMATRRQGDAINAETVVAYKQAMIAADEKLAVLAQAVKDNPNDLAAQLALRKGAATSHAIKMEFMGARAEAGRALNAFKIMDENNPYRGLDLETRLREAGGAEAAQEMADLILKMKAKKGHAFDMISPADHWKSSLKTIYVNGLLSGAGTPLANVIGATINVMQDTMARITAETVGKALGGTEFESGETMQMITGYLGGMRDAWRLRPAEAFPEGVTRGLREDSGSMGYVDPRKDRPLSAAAFQVDEASVLGRVLNVLDVTVRAPQIANGWADDYFGVMSARASLQGSAFKKAMREGREAGGWTPEQMKERQAELLANPTRDMLEEAERHAKEMTFTRDDGAIDKAMQSVRRTLDDLAPGLPFGTAIMPFMRTPSNIISLGMRNSPLAPFSHRWWEDISAGGVRKEMALTQMAVGTGLYGVFMEMSMSGDLTGGGPGNRAQRQAMEREGFNGGVGWQPYSIRVGDRWYQYSRFEPLGQSMAIVGDFMEILANDDWDEASAEDGGEVASHVIGSIGKAFFDKNMLAGAFDFFEAVRSGDGVKVENELGKRASAMVPFSGAARMGRRGVDPYMRETSSVLDDIKNGIPLLSDDLAIQRDLWGNERTYQSGLGTVYDAINLTKTRATGGNAIDFELQDQGISLTMPSRTFSINGMSVSLKNRPDIYSRFVELSGVAAYEHLEAVASGNHPDAAMYFSMTDGPAGEKAAYIKSVVDGYRKAAKEQVMEEYGADLMRMGDAKLKRLEGRAAE